MEFMLGLFVGAIGWGILLLVAIIWLWSVHSDYWFTCILSFVLTASILVQQFGVSMLGVCVGVLVYLLVGFLNSFWRYKRYLDVVVARCENQTISLSTAKNKMYLGNNLNMIAMFILNWPVYSLVSIVGDLVSITKPMITRIGNVTYQKWSNDRITKLEMIYDKKE